MGAASFPISYYSLRTVKILCIQYPHIKTMLVWPIGMRARERHTSRAMSKETWVVSPSLLLKSATLVLTTSTVAVGYGCICSFLMKGLMKGTTTMNEWMNEITEHPTCSLVYWHRIALGRWRCTTRVSRSLVCGYWWEETLPQQLQVG